MGPSRLQTADTDPTLGSLSFRLERFEQPASPSSPRRLLMCSITNSSASLLTHSLLALGTSAVTSRAVQRHKANSSSNSSSAPASTTNSRHGSPTPAGPASLLRSSRDHNTSSSRGFSSSRRFPMCLNAPPSEVQPLSYLLHHAERPEAQPAPATSNVSTVRNSIRGRPLRRRAKDAGAAGAEQAPIDPADLSLYQSFRELDINRDGHVDGPELEAALLKMGLPVSREYIAELLRQYDQNADKSIDFDEFRTYARRNEQDMKRAFKYFDKDEDGEISSEELVVALQRAGAPARAGDVRRMMQLLHRGKDGPVSYQEFCRFACMLPKAQTSSGSHMLYAWANSALWTEDERDRRAPGGGPGGGASAAAHLSGSPNESVHRLLIGGVAGVMARTLIAPLERLRTMMMLSSSNLGFRGAVSQMWADGGAAGLFKGHMSTVVKVFPTSAIQFGVVHQTKHLIRQLKQRDGVPASAVELNQLDCFLAGALAGGISCVVSHPLDTIRTAMAVAIGSKVGMVGTAQAIVARAGLGGLYSGFGLSCMQEVLGNGLGFLAVDIGSQWHRRQHDGMAPSAKDRALIAATGAAIVMTALMPLDVVVKRLQVQGCAGHPVLFAGPIDAFVKIAQQQGLGAFYRGLATTYLKTGPSMGCLYFFYDQLSRAFGVGGLTRYRLQQD